MAAPVSFPRDACGTATGPHLPSDIIALIGALKIDKAVLGAFDWGARTAQHRGSALARAASRRWFSVSAT